MTKRREPRTLGIETHTQELQFIEFISMPACLSRVEIFCARSRRSIVKSNEYRKYGTWI
jgi:hypothetical protein